MRLNDWDKVLDHADKCVRSLNDEGIKAEAVVYRLDGGGKGVCLQVFDKKGNLFSQHDSGIWNTVDEYKKALNRNMWNIMENH
jgi:hypothetical protein